MDDLSVLRSKLKDIFLNLPVKLSPNRSSRRGSAIRAAVVHTTESSDSSYEAIIGYFGRESSQASSHYVIDVDGPGRFARVTLVVAEGEKAWTARSANPVTMNYELIGRASRSRGEWLVKNKQLETLAALVAEDSIQYGFPVSRSYPGVLGHCDLSRFGFPNDHTDPGAAFPWDLFLSRVQFYVAASKVRPAVGILNVKGCPRPASAPRVIPPWAWSMMKWHDKFKAGPRPRLAPARIPEWYWLWRGWKRGVVCKEHAAHDV